MSWYDKAYRVVGELCLDSYKQANYRRGKKYKKHRPYSVPLLAKLLIEALDEDDEEQAKSLFIRYSMGLYSKGD